MSVPPAAPATPAPPPPPVIDDDLPLPVEQSAPHYVRTMLEEYFRERGFKNPAKEAVRFMRAHASIVLVMPTTPVIERLALETSVGDSMHKDPSGGNAARLAALHNVPRRQLSKMFKRAKGTGLAAHRALSQAVEQHCRQYLGRRSRFTRRGRV